MSSDKLTFKSALANILAVTNTNKQSTEVFVLWLRNQRYYTSDVIGIKMTYPTMKVSGPKHAVNINFMKISTKITQTIYIPLENGAQLGPTLSYPLVLSIS